jgi:MFS family permease
MTFIREIQPTNFTPARTAQAVGGTRAWITVGFLFLFMLVNYADRAVLGLAAVAVQSDLGLTSTQFGSIASAFFFCYALSGLGMGFIINRAKTRWMLFILAIVWSIAQFPMLFAPSFLALMVTRMILGAGEGPAYPAAVHGAFRWFPDAKRTLPVSVITQGSAVGVVLAAPIINWTILQFGWQTAFGALGFVGLIWAAAWLWYAQEGPVDSTVTAAGVHVERVPYGKLIFNPTVLTTWLTVFAAFWTLSLLLAWYPSYLRRGLGFSAESVGFLASLPWAGGALVILLFGWQSQRMLGAGHSSRVSRVIFVCIGGCIGACCLLALPFIEEAWLKVVFVGFGVVLPNAIFAPAQAVLGEVSPVPQRGAVLAIGNAVASTAGMIAPIVTGKFLDSAVTPIAGYEAGFVVCGLVVAAANVLGLLLIKPEAQARKFAAMAH